MPYKISGTTDAARIIIIEESGWTVESNTNESSGAYEVDSLDSSNKLVIARKSDGEVIAYGNVSGEEYTVPQRGVFAGGYSASGYNNVMDYITISTAANATDFGDLTANRNRIPGCSNGSTGRGIFIGGYSGANLQSVDYITISSAGNATSYGDIMTEYKRDGSACSNATGDRAVYAGGYTGSGSPDNQMEYTTISTGANATHFGYLRDTGYDDVGLDNGTNNRGIFAGGYNYTHSRMNWIDYITITSPGNATDFGDLTAGAAERPGGTSNRTNNRGLIAGGHDSGGSKNNIDYITITSTGNAQDFGDLTHALSQMAGISSGTNERAVFAGGAYGGSGNYNYIDYVTISSTGNASDFGDLTLGRLDLGGCANA